MTQLTDRLIEHGRRYPRMQPQDAVKLIYQNELGAEHLVSDVDESLSPNSIATAAMLKVGADAGATGENPVIAASRKADVIIGPVGIIAADSLLGEITPAMAAAIGQSGAKKLLIPVNLCNNIIIGTQSLPMSKLISETVEQLKAVLHKAQLITAEAE